MWIVVYVNRSVHTHVYTLFFTNNSLSLEMSGYSQVSFITGIPGPKHRTPKAPFHWSTICTCY